MCEIKCLQRCGGALSTGRASQALFFYLLVLLSFSPFIFSSNLTGAHKTPFILQPPCEDGDLLVDCQDISLSCVGNTAQLVPNTNAVNATFSWTGPNDFSSDDQFPIVSETGSYDLIVTDENGCIGTSTIIVSEAPDGPEITASGGDIACNSPWASLTASSNAVDNYFSWSGPDGFSSNLQNPDVDQEGDYSLTVTDLNTGCKSSYTVHVDDLSEYIEVQAIGPDMECDESSVELYVSTDIDNPSYSWSGPNGFTSNIENPSVSEAGSYLLTITDPVSGCEASDYATVDIVDGGLDLQAIATGGTIDCENATIALYSTAEGENLTYSWTGPDGFESDQQYPEVSLAGTYSMTVTTVNGCSDSDNATVHLHQDEPTIELSASNNAVLDCENEIITIDIDANLSGLTFEWTGPYNFNSNNENASIQTAGTYQVTASTEGGCSTTKSITILQNSEIPNISAQAGSITCLEDVAQLQGFVPLYGNLEWGWTGPEGFSSSQNLSSTEIPGVYTFTATDILSGCTSSVQVTVEDDRDEIGIWAPGNTITCDSTVAFVCVYHNDDVDNSFSYQWNGPNGFQTKTQHFYADETGEYTITISSSNGCSETVTTTVDIDIESPEFTFAVEHLSCIKEETQFELMQSGGEWEYEWTGPNGFTSTLAEPMLAEPGSYLVTAYNPDNYCSESQVVEVELLGENTDVQIEGSNISCGDNSTMLHSLVMGGQADYEWTLPNGTTSNTPELEATTTGEYTLTVYFTESGCEKTDSYTVESTGDLPNVSLQGATITCEQSEVELAPENINNIYDYLWTGPAGFTSSNAQITTETVGNYELLVTDPSSGCSVIALTSVDINNDLPELNISGEHLSCNNQEATLSPILVNGIQEIQGEYNWQGPNGYYSEELSIVVTEPGSYVFSHNMSSNGCSNQASFTVDMDDYIGNPSSNSLQLNCEQNTAALPLEMEGNGNYQFFWQGPNGFSSNAQNPEVTSGGNYEVQIVNVDNGCSEILVLNVTQEDDIPEINSFGSDITCEQSSGILTVETDLINPEISWSGPNGFSSNSSTAIVEVAGVYTVTVTDPISSCSNTEELLVESLTDLPQLSADPLIMECNQEIAILSVISNQIDVSYFWQGPNGFISNEDSPSTTQTGTYAVLVTNSITGCQNFLELEVVESEEMPTVEIAAQNINCNSQGSLNAMNIQASYELAWSGPEGFSYTGNNAAVSVPGIYNLTATDPETGCNSTASVTIIDESNIPSVITEDIQLSCSESFLNAITDQTGLEYFWQGPNGFSSTVANPLVTESGDYSVIVYNPNNGCTSNSSLAVIDGDNNLEYNLMNGDINCTENGFIEIQATEDYTVTITGPNNFTVIEYSTEITQAGIYQVSIFDEQTDCEINTSIFISENTTAPLILVDDHHLDCTENTQLSAISDEQGLVYYWQGPNGYVSYESTPTVNAPGTYALIATNTENSCEQFIEFEVIDLGDMQEVAIAQQNINCNTAGSINALNILPNYELEWTGPEGFYFTGNNAEVEVAGIYNLTATDPETGCNSTASVTVLDESIIPSVSAEDIHLSCSESFLSATTDQNDLEYFWQGPNGFSSTAENPQVTEAGNYSVIVSNPNNGCSSDASLTVINGENNLQYSVSNGDIDCSESGFIQIDADPNYTVTITGPNDFTVSNHTTEVTQAGIYQISIFDEQSNCETNTSISINENTTTPLVLVDDHLLNCAENIQISAISDEQGLIYFWQGPNGFISYENNPTISSPGSYALIATNPQNSCEQFVEFEVIDTGTPILLLPSSNPITCNSSGQIGVTGINTSTQIIWEGPEGFSFTGSNTTVSIPGVYTATAFDTESSCSATASITVLDLQSTPTVSTNSIELNCNNGIGTLNSISENQNLQYNWIGPDGFSSTEQNPSVSEAGMYYLTVIDPSNGCSALLEAEVTKNENAPVIELNNSNINCNAPSAEMSVSSTTENITIEWYSNDALISNSSNLNVTEAGEYEVIVIDNESGCSSIGQVSVLELINDDIQFEINSPNINCSNPNPEITVLNPTSNYNFDWSGPEGFSSEGSSAIVSLPGVYLVNITDPTTLCQSQLSVVVEDHRIDPIFEITSTEITCNDPLASLAVQSSNENISINWEGPEGFQSEAASSSTNLPGIYTVTVSNPMTGCSNSQSIEVTENTHLELANPAGGILYCNDAFTQIASGITNPQLQASWSGPNGFSSTEFNASVSEAGIYSLVVSDPVNGCQSLHSVQVTSQDDSPTIQASGAMMDCNQSSVQLQASSSVPGSDYSWTGPGDFSNNSPNPFVELAGVYTVTATSPNGCSSSSNILVSDFTSSPEIYAQGGTITCEQTQVTLSAGPSDPSLIFVWNGPAGYVGEGTEIVVSEPGNYTVSASNLNTGCSAAAQASVSMSDDLPEFSLTVEDIDCVSPFGNLFVEVSSGHSVEWTDPNGFVMDGLQITSDVPGVYQIRVTNNQTGCQTTQSAILQQIELEVLAIGGAIDCENDELQIFSQALTPGASFMWSGPEDFSSFEQNPIVTIPGEYTVTAFYQNCVDFASTIVADEKEEINVQGDAPPILCPGEMTMMEAMEPQGNMMYTWEGPQGFTASGPQAETNMPGMYMLTAMDMETLCQGDVEIMVEMGICPGDLALIKQLAPGIQDFAAGDEVTFNITVINQSEIPANNIALVDYYPEGLLLNDVDWFASSSTTANYLITDTLAGGAEVTIPISFIISPDLEPSTLHNYAEIVSALNELGEPYEDEDSQADNDQQNDVLLDDELDNNENDEDDHDIASINVLPIPVFDLALSKNLKPGSPQIFEAGDLIDFQITVSNQGNIPAANILIVDYLNEFMILADEDWSPAGNNAAYFHADVLNPGDAFTIEITVELISGYEVGIPLYNYAEISSATDSNGDLIPDIDSTPDSDPENDPIDEDDFDFAVINTDESGVSDIALIKTLKNPQEAYLAGQEVIFIISLENQGDIAAYNIQLIDYIPEQLILNDMNWFANSGSSANLLFAGPLQAGAQAEIEIAFIINPNASPESISNYAEIMAAQDEFGNPFDDEDSSFDGINGNDNLEDDEWNNLNDDEDDHDVAILEVSSEEEFDLAISKELIAEEGALFQAGDLIDFKITVKNEGELTAANITVVDYLHEFMILADSDWSSNQGNAYHTFNGILPAGHEFSVNITVQLIEGFEAGTPLYNYAEIATATDEDGNPVTDVDSDPDDQPNNDPTGEDDIDNDFILTVSEPSVSDLALIKELDGDNIYFYPGDEITFNITVRNQGNVTAHNVQVLDFLPSGLVLIDTNWEMTGPWTASYFLPEPLEASEELVIPITFLLDNIMSPGPRSNFAEIGGAEIANGLPFNDIDSSPNDDPGDDVLIDDEWNNSNNDEDDHDIAIFTILASPFFDLSLTKELKAGSPQTYEGGDLVTFTISVENEGNQVAANIEVSDYLNDYLSLSDSDWSLSPAGATYQFTGELAPGETFEVDITCELLENAPTDAPIVNVAEISAATDENGDPVTDIDSEPDAIDNNDPANEDDIDDAFVLLNVECEIQVGSLQVLEEEYCAYENAFVFQQTPSVFPSSFTATYLLSDEEDLIIQSNTSGLFEMEEQGNYFVYLLIADASEINPANYDSIFEIEASVAASDCAELSNSPATFAVVECEGPCELTLPNISAPTLVCDGDDLTVELSQAIVLPSEFDHYYLLIENGNIIDHSQIPLFEAPNSGEYEVYLFYVANTSEIEDFASLAILQNNLISNGGWTCGALSNTASVSIGSCGTNCEDFSMDVCTYPVEPITVCADFCSSTYTISEVESIFPSGLTVLDNNCIRYTPSPGFMGTDVVYLEACDEFNNCATAEVMVVVGDCDGNETPTAVKDQAETEEGESVEINILDNDFDEDGDQISLCLEFGDLNPQNGNVQIVASGIVYQPNAGFIGTEVMNYTICDENGETSIAQVCIEVIEGCNGPLNQEFCEGNMVPIEICIEYCDEEMVIEDIESTWNCSITTLSDHCFRYISLPMFYGTELLTITACNDDICVDSQVIVEVDDDCIDDGLNNKVEMQNSLLLPQILSPNGDGINENLNILNNDRQALKSQEGTISLFNADGSLMYQGTFSLREDGLLIPENELQRIPDGHYFYSIEFQTRNSEYSGSTQNGHFQIIH